MVSRVDSSETVKAGQAHLCVERVAGESAVVRAEATSPLKLLTPRARGQSVWAYLSSYGGGMVAGDGHRLNVRVGPNAEAFFGTQSSTKVYRTSDGLVCEQRAVVEIGGGGFLAWVPDPVQPFDGAAYRQSQEFHLQPDSNLVFLDSFTAGRSERGEHWAFTEYRSRTEFWIAGTRRLLDSIFLRSDQSSMSVDRRMGSNQALSLLVLLGPELECESRELIGSIARQPVGRAGEVRVSASPLAGGALVRISGPRVENVRQRVSEFLSFLPNRLGDDPFARKW